MTVSEQSTVSVADPHPTGGHAPRRPVLAPVLAAVLVAAGMGALVLSRLLPGPLLLAVAGVVVLAVPTSRELPRRVAYLGCVALGFAPMVWLVRLPTDVPRVGLGVAAVAAGLAAWVAVDPRRRAPRLLPRWRAADGLLALAAGWIGITLMAFLRPGSAERALALLQAGWDHSAHFSMTMSIRGGGALVSQLPESDFGDWSYASYPQGYHTAVASVMELLGGRHVGTAPQEVVLYDRGMAIVVGMALVTLAAALLSLPALRRRPLAAAPVLVLLVVAFTEGPGGRLLVDGFPNFVVAVALLAALPLLVVPLERPLAPVPLAAVAGAALGVAHNWIMLVPIAATALVVLALPLRRRRWPRRGRDWWVPGVIATLTVLGVGHAALIASPSMTSGRTLITPGGIGEVSIGLLATLLAAALAVPLLAVAAGARPAGLSADARLRTGWTVAMVLVGMALATVIGVIQQRGMGGLSYYFWKLAVGVELLGVAVIAVGAVAALRPRPAVTRGAAAARVTGVVTLCIALSQVFGVTFAASGTDPLAGASSGAQTRQASAHTEVTVGTALVLGASTAAPPGQLVALVPYPNPGSLNVISAAQWVNAFSQSWTNRANSLAARVGTSFTKANEAFAVPSDPTPAELQDAAVHVARVLLAADPDVRVLVAPQYVDSVRDAVAHPERVLSW